MIATERAAHGKPAARDRAVACALAVLLVLCALAPAAIPEGTDGALTPLYLAIVVHNEEDTHGAVPKANIPDYDGDEALMHHFAAAMRGFAQMAAGHGARINFGSDWTFSHGVALHEPSFYTDLEALGHEIDAHAHESSIPYSEVREEIALAGGHPTHVASGMNEETIQEELDAFDATYPEFQILWGVSLPGHGEGECTASWAWRPSRDDWTVHDPDGRYIYIGHGELLNSLAAIRSAVENRAADRLNTYAVFVSPREFKADAGTPGIAEQWTVPTDSVHYWENKLAWWDDFLTQVDALVAAGVVQYASLTEIAERFVASEDALDFDFGEVPRSDLSMRARNLKAGYPLDD
jgi:hypothetical protein